MGALSRDLEVSLRPGLIGILQATHDRFGCLRATAQVLREELLQRRPSRGLSRNLYDHQSGEPWDGQAGLLYVEGRTATAFPVFCDLCRASTRRAMCRPV